MQSARIWFQKRIHAETLTSLKAFLEGELKCTVVFAEWRLGSFVVPQLDVSAPRKFLLQIDDHPDIVPAEAREFSDRRSDALSSDQAKYLAASDARIDIGLNDPPPIVSDRGLTAFAGFSSIDPAEPQLQELLRAITRRVQGVLEDNVNGHIWLGMK
jgi:hypothetical protein